MEVSMAKAKTERGRFSSRKKVETVLRLDYRSVQKVEV
jgi:hypothetical protein